MLLSDSNGIASEAFIIIIKTITFSISTYTELVQTN